MLCTGCILWRPSATDEGRLSKWYDMIWYDVSDEIPCRTPSRWVGRRLAWTARPTDTSWRHTSWRQRRPGWQWRRWWSSAATSRDRWRRPPTSCRTLLARRWCRTATRTARAARCSTWRHQSPTLTSRSARRRSYSAPAVTSFPPSRWRDRRPIQRTAITAQCDGDISSSAVVSS